MVAPLTTRRHFFRQSAMASAALLAAQGGIAQDAPRPLRLGFIGVGNRGSSLLRDTLEMKGIQVVSITDTYDVWRARAVVWCKEHYPDVTDYIKFERMISGEELDAVVIATPDHIHAPAILEAIEAGLDVYVEKPMTLTEAESQAVVEAAKEKGTVLQVGTQLRSQPTYQKVREVVQSGDLGKLTLVQVNRHYKGRNLAKATPPEEANENNVHWKTFLRHTQRYKYDPVRYFKWRKFRDYSNGYFGDLMLQHLDMCHFVTGATTPTRISASGGIYLFDDGRTCPDTISALIEYPGQFQFNFACTSTNGHYGLVERYLFSGGTIEVKGMTDITIIRGDIKEEIKGEGINNTLHLQNFFDAIHSRGTTIAPVEAGALASTITHRAMISTMGEV